MTRASPLLSKSLMENDLLLSNNFNDFVDNEYLHVYVLDRSLRVSESYLKYCSSREERGEVSMSKNYMVCRQECSLGDLNIDIFYLLLQDMIRQRTLDQVRIVRFLSCSSVESFICVVIFI